jgi:hypothetical protein
VRDIAIPITEFRIKWTCELSRIIGVGLGADTSVWWEVPVPPGVMPLDGGIGILHENTIVFFGVLGAVEVNF